MDSHSNREIIIAIVFDPPATLKICQIQTNPLWKWSAMQDVWQRQRSRDPVYTTAKKCQHKVFHRGQYSISQLPWTKLLKMWDVTQVQQQRLESPMEAHLACVHKLHLRYIFIAAVLVLRISSANPSLACWFSMSVLGFILFQILKTCSGSCQ